MIVIVSVMLGVLFANMSIFKDTGKSVFEQIQTLRTKTKESVLEYSHTVDSKIKLGEVAIDMNIVGIDNINSYTIENNMAYMKILDCKAGDLVRKEGFVRGIRKENELNSEYTLVDYYATEDEVEAYEVFYHILSEDEGTVSLLLCNNTGESIQAEKAQVFAIGVEGKEGYYGFNNITVGTSKEYIYNTFKGSLKNTHNLVGYETYIDDNNNFIFIIYNDNNRVESFMTGNTLGEQIILTAITN